MSTKYGLLILAGLFVAGGVFVYYKTAVPVKQTPQSNNTNGKAVSNAITSGVAGLVNSGFNGLNGLFTSPKAGVSANQPILTDSNMNSGINLLTNTNNTTGTTGDMHADTTSS